MQCRVVAPSAAASLLILAAILAPATVFGQGLLTPGAQQDRPLLGASNVQQALLSRLLQTSKKAARRQLLQTARTSCKSSSGGSIPPGCTLGSGAADGATQQQLLLATSPSEFFSTDLKWTGQRIVTPAVDQGTCATCTVFAAVAAAETARAVALRDNAMPSDLSVQDFYFCVPDKAFARTCTTGWTLPGALEDLSTRGPELLTNRCLPYIPARSATSNPIVQEQLCKPRCSSKSGLLRSGGGSAQLTRSAVPDLVTAQLYIRHYGAVLTRFDVYSDLKPFFAANPKGIYRPAANASFQEAHAVVLVGYDNEQEFFLAKNSWGPGFADNGFFRVAFGCCSVIAGDAYAVFFRPATGLTVKPLLAEGPPKPDGCYTYKAVKGDYLSNIAFKTGLDGDMRSFLLQNIDIISNLDEDLLPPGTPVRICQPASGSIVWLPKAARPEPMQPAANTKAAATAVSPALNPSPRSGGFGGGFAPSSGGLGGFAAGSGLIGGFGGFGGGGSPASAQGAAEGFGSIQGVTGGFGSIPIAMAPPSAPVPSPCVPSSPLDGVAATGQPYRQLKGCPNPGSSWLYVEKFLSQAEAAAFCSAAGAALASFLTRGDTETVQSLLSGLLVSPTASSSSGGKWLNGRAAAVLWMGLNRSKEAAGGAAGGGGGWSWPSLPLPLPLPLPLAGYRNWAAAEPDNEDAAKSCGVLGWSWTSLRWFSWMPRLASPIAAVCQLRSTELPSALFPEPPVAAPARFRGLTPSSDYASFSYALASQPFAMVTIFSSEVTWEEAAQRCRVGGGQSDPGLLLFFASSRQELQELNQAVAEAIAVSGLQQLSRLWLNIFRAAGSQQWVWGPGVPGSGGGGAGVAAGLLNWNPGQPSGSDEGQRRCVELTVSSSLAGSVWHSAAACGEKRAFVCRRR